MPEKDVGTVSRDRKRGNGKMYVNPEVIQIFQDLAPEWQGFSGRKVANLLDRNLPFCPTGTQSICLNLPGGKKRVSIPLMIEEDPAGNSIHIQAHPKKKVAISTV